MEPVLTAQKAKSARNAAQLSQGKVATDLGINRSYLSLFESGKYVLDDNTLAQLRDYYQDHGVNLNGESVAPNNVRMMGNYVRFDGA
jgi:transcriptional regulator with XRE-family HTH domain